MLIERDIHLSSNELFDVLAGGITDAGVDVADTGATTTLMTYWGTGEYNFDTSPVITASHNPKNHNGLKFSGKNVLPVGYDNGPKRLKKIVESNTITMKKNIRDFYYSDCGKLASLIIRNIVSELKKQAKKLSKLMAFISPYFNTGEVNFMISKKQEAMNAVVDYFMANEKPKKIYDFVGHNLECLKWWLNIKPSNTEPYLRFSTDTGPDNLLKEKTALIYTILNKYKK